MTAPGNELMYFVFTLSVFVSSGYAVGRIHQWHRHGVERDEAYRGGYDKASRSIIGMMPGRDTGSPTLNGPGVPITNSAYSRRGTSGACGHRISVNQRHVYPVHQGKADRAGR
ncbi:hypothetical protein [Actinoplanes awajinensis]|nr:hypothetical protein [Actinoplanes awajinensis]